MAPFQLGTAKILNVKPLPLDEAKWIGLEAIDWQDEEGKKRRWESANRKTRSKGGIDAVAILALISHPNRPLSTVIILQFRPPVGKICVELPAGLIDEGETPQQAAERELTEETGYEGKVSELSSTIVSDPGMSAANMALATIKVDLKEGDKVKEAQLDEGEHIEKRVVEVATLYETLLDLGKDPNLIVDARLFHIAQGIHLGQQLAKGKL